MRGLSKLQFSLPQSFESSKSRLPLIRAKRFRESTVQGPPEPPKEPIISFVLSASSFLVCTITETGTNWPLYQIRTSNTTTTIKRKESHLTTVVTASIKWPKIIPMARRKDLSEPVTVLVRNVLWRAAGSLLKPGTKESSGEFQFPELHKSLIWKLDGDQYKCTISSSSVLIAILRPWRGNRRVKLTVYEDPYGHRPRHSVYGGISTLFLDHLVVSALLLVTDLQEWVRVSNLLESPSDSEPELGANTLQSWEEIPPPLTNRQTSLDSSLTTQPTVPTVTPFQNLPPVQTGSLLRHSQPLHSWLNTDSDSASDQVSPMSDGHSPAIESNHSHVLNPSPFPIEGPTAALNTQSYATSDFPLPEKSLQSAHGSTLKSPYPPERSQRPLPPIPTENGRGMPLSGLGRPSQRFVAHTDMADNVYPRFLVGPSSQHSHDRSLHHPNSRQPITEQDVAGWSRGDIQELLMLESPPPSYHSHSFPSELE